MDAAVTGFGVSGERARVASLHGKANRREAQRTSAEAAEDYFRTAGTLPNEQRRTFQSAG